MAILKKALAALRRQLGAHPDVEALALRIEGARARRQRFSVPRSILPGVLDVGSPMVLDSNGPEG
ncbi:hypothetical protein [Polyangium fumosum]|uniref:Uncharacterized protein n=1 Tax=Polyangium fumosum TaxID=889272 RepID=A0A4U1IV15_9BACT|nr:hypothetical protein [Polyangium fumosum]TKC98303.1 hypothetical protein E8A74_41765 [Polyangium fumosum]